MPLEPGTALGPYEVVAPLGAGGMGEVYRARDTRLDREVAVKVLPEHLSASDQARQRFEREARSASSLNHPNICTIHDIGTHEGTDYLVMELLDGETLAKRLERGPLSLAELLEVALPLADALDRAHRNGLVHRDLKPGNVMLTRSGVKLLDFGLAKVIAASPEVSSLTALPTAASPLTAQGTLVGTFQYMAPEQLEGKEADARTDIFAFGCILHEMATGARAFDGKTQAGVMAAILERDPEPLSRIQPGMPAALERLVRTCLEKDREERRQSMHDVLLELRWISEGGVPAGPDMPAGRAPGAGKLPWLLAGVLALGCIALATAWIVAEPAPPPTVRTFIPAPEGTQFLFLGDGPGGGGPVTLSPDGSKLAFVAQGGDGEDLLWVRRLDSVVPVAVPNTEGARYPFWAPDSRTLAFFAGKKLRKIDTAGGPPLTLSDAPGGRGGSWSEEGLILFTPEPTGPVHKVSASGGTSEPVTVFDENRHETHRWAWFLPDNRHFLYFVRFREGINEPDEIRIGSLDDPVGRVLLHADRQAIYASGHLLYTQGSALMARPFDPGAGELTGDAFPIAEEVSVDEGYDWSFFTASGNGVLCYLTGEFRAGNKLTWVDRDGKEREVVSEGLFHTQPDISPDGKQAVVQIIDPTQGGDLWIFDLTRSLKTRFTFGAADGTSTSTSPVFSPDGTEIAYARETDGVNALYRKSLLGTGDAVLLARSGNDMYPMDWSRDGRFLLYVTYPPQTSGDIWVLPMEEGGEPRPFLQAAFEENNPAFSPDGRWIAYHSDESGPNEVYVTPFPNPGRKWQVSVGGGSKPQWRADGRELFFWSTSLRRLMGAEVLVQDDTFQVGKVHELAEFRQGARFKTYDPTADGRRFLVVESPDTSDPAPLTLVTSWTSEIEGR